MADNRKGQVYITSQDNGQFFQGWLPGTARHGFCRKTCMIRNITTEKGPFGDTHTGQIRLQGLDLVVTSHNMDRDWEIQSTVDGKVTRFGRTRF